MLICALLATSLLQTSALRTSPASATSPGSKVGALLSCGHWEPSFQHDVSGFPAFLTYFNAAHIALIPKGPHRGKVLTWDIRADATTSEWKQRWSILDPAGPSFENHLLTMPADEGDLFCAGFAWTKDGDLLVVGGTSQYPLALVAQPDPGTSSTGLVASDRCPRGVQCCCARGGTSPTAPTPAPAPSCGGCGCGCNGHGGHGGHDSDGDGYLGGKLTYLWNPDDSVWYRQPDLGSDRWYPTTINLGDGKLLVAGGVGAAGGLDATHNYEVFVKTGSTPPTGTWQPWFGGQIFPGPFAFVSALYIYPRLHLLTSGELFLAGMTGYATRLDHSATPGLWEQGEKSFFGARIYGTSVLSPYVPDALGNYEDEVLILGGIGMHLVQPGSRSRATGSSAVVQGNTIQGNFEPVGVQATTEHCHPNAADKSWQPGPSMTFARKFSNAVHLPDGSLFVVGGNSGPGDNQPVWNAELFDGTSWTVLPPIDTRRNYHSTAALLPDGRVLIGGGNSSTRAYQIFVPSYLCGGAPRPVITSSPATMGYYDEDPLVHTIAFTPMSGGHSVERAVLITPAAVTHHTDYNQRYVQLIVDASAADHIDVRAPATRNLVPPGYYMLFLLSTAGVPSQAAWVKVE